MEQIAFVLLSAVALGSALVIVTPLVRNTVVCALALALNLVAIAGLFFLLQAQFIAFLQIIVYAGAIMVLILFVIMLLSSRDDGRPRPAGFFQRTLGGAAAILFAGLVVSGVISTAGGGKFPEPPPEFGTVRTLGLELFERFYYPFEAISLLLVVAMIGAVLMAKRRL